MYQFRNMVFEGGGVKGIAYGGAIIELEQRGLLAPIKRFAGTSAGAINATLLALGYSADDVSDLVAETNFAQFADDDYGVIRDTKRLLDEYGWHKGSKFETWIGRRIAAKSGKKELTFAQLHELAEDRPEFRDLYVVGTNLSLQQPEYYSFETTPDMQIKKAVRISMGIPLYFRAVFNDEDEVLVDGGVTRNYPIDLFDHTRYLDNQDNGESVTYNATPGFVFNHETLGFRLDDQGLKEDSLRTSQPIPADIDNIYTYAQALVTYMRQMAGKLHIHKNDWNRTITIDTTGVGVTEFDISNKKIEQLVANGKAGVVRHFDWRQSDQGMDLPG